MNAETALVSAHMTIDSAVAEWLAQKETIGSKRTRAEYEETMRRFRALLAQGSLDLLSNPIDIARIAALWANMRAPNTRRPGQDVSPAMYNQRLAILSSFYTFLQDTYKLEIPNPIKDVKKRKVQAYAAALSIAPETVEEGLDRIDRNSSAGLRDYALLAVALYTGRRASELAGLRGGDVKIQGRSQVTFHCKGKQAEQRAGNQHQDALEHLRGPSGYQQSPRAPTYLCRRDGEKWRADHRPGRATRTHGYQDHPTVYERTHGR